MADLDLDALEVLASAATEGPWEAYTVPGERNKRGYSAVGAGDTEMQIIRYEGGYFDAAFIAAARTAVPALIARVRELEAQRDAVLASHSRVENNRLNGWLGDPYTSCRECGTGWPCATVLALTDTEGSTT